MVTLRWTSSFPFAHSSGPLLLDESHLALTDLEGVPDRLYVSLSERGHLCYVLIPSTYEGVDEACEPGLGYHAWELPEIDAVIVLGFVPDEVLAVEIAVGTRMEPARFENNAFFAQVPDASLNPQEVTPILTYDLAGQRVRCRVGYVPALQHKFRTCFEALS